MEVFIESLVAGAPAWILFVLYLIDVFKKKYKKHLQMKKQYKRFKQEYDYWLDYELSPEEYLTR